MEMIRITPAAARVNAGMFQKQAADALGVTVETLRNYEKGVTVPNWETVMKMVRVYGMPADHFYFGKDLALSAEDAPPPQ